MAVRLRRRITPLHVCISRAAANGGLIGLPDEAGRAESRYMATDGRRRSHFARTTCTGEDIDDCAASKSLISLIQVKILYRCRLPDEANRARQLREKTGNSLARAQIQPIRSQEMKSHHFRLTLLLQCNMIQQEKACSMRIGNRGT